MGSFLETQMLNLVQEVVLNSERFSHMCFSSSPVPKYRTFQSENVRTLVSDFSFCLFLSMPLVVFFFLLLCFTKEFSSSVENVWLLPVEFCVASQLCVFVSSGGRRIWEIVAVGSV